MAADLLGSLARGAGGAAGSNPNAEALVGIATDYLRRQSQAAQTQPPPPSDGEQ